MEECSRQQKHCGGVQEVGGGERTVVFLREDIHYCYSAAFKGGGGEIGSCSGKAGEVGGGQGAGSGVGTSS